MRISDWSSDVCSSDLQVNLRRSILLTGQTALSNKPDLIAWHGLDAVIEHAMAMSISNPYTTSGEQACQSSLSTASPANLFPFFLSQDRNSTRLNSSH